MLTAMVMVLAFIDQHVIDRSVSCFDVSNNIVYYVTKKNELVSYDNKTGSKKTISHFDKNDEFDFFIIGQDKFILSGTENGRHHFVVLVDAKDGSLIRKFYPHEDYISSIICQKARIYSGSYDGSVRVTDPGGKSTVLYKDKGQVSGMALIDEKRLAVVTKEGVLAILETSGKVISKTKTDFFLEEVIVDKSDLVCCGGWFDLVKDQPSVSRSGVVLFDVNSYQQKAIESYRDKIVNKIVPFGNGRLCLGWRLHWESDPVAIKSFVIYQGKEFALRAWEVISAKVLGSGQDTEQIVVCLHSNKELVKYVINGK